MAGPAEWALSTSHVSPWPVTCLVAAAPANAGPPSSRGLHKCCAPLLVQAAVRLCCCCCCCTGCQGNLCRALSVCLKSCCAAHAGNVCQVTQCLPEVVLCRTCCRCRGRGWSPSSTGTCSSSEGWLGLSTGNDAALCCKLGPAGHRQCLHAACMCLQQGGMLAGCWDAVGEQVLRGTVQYTLQLLADSALQLCLDGLGTESAGS